MLFKKINFFWSIDAIIIISVVILLYHFIFNCPVIFNQQLDINGQYFTLFIGMSVLVIVLIVSILNFNIQRNQQLIFDLLLLAFFIILLLRSISFGNEYMAISIILLFYAFVHLINDKKLSIIIFIFIAFWLYQLILILGDFKELIYNNDPLYFQGSMHNSGVLSCYLVIHLPLVYYLIFHSKFTNANKYILLNRIIKFIISPSIIAVVTIILYKTQSRTAIIALLFVSVIVCLSYIKAIFYKVSLIAKIGMLSLSTLTVVFFFYYLYQIKKLSAIGRVLAIKVSLSHLSDHFWLGTGLGKFTLLYPQWQVDYFKYTPNPPKELFLSAGEIYFAFNEYIQLFETQGIIVFLIICFVFVWFFSLKSDSYYPLLFYIKLTVAVILICGITTYSLHITSVLFLLVCCLSIGFKIGVTNLYVSNSIFSSKNKLFCIQICMIFLSLICFVESFKQYVAYSNWQELKNFSTLNRQQIKEKYKTLSYTLESNPKFLVSYGEYLSQDTLDCKQAISILEHAKQNFLTIESVYSTGTTYWQIKNYKKAIQNFEWLNYYIPNRFEFKYQLLRLYCEVGNRFKVHEIGMKILKMPVKIPSSDIETIKQETAKILDANNKQASD